MPAKVPEEKKIEVLTYAKENGVVQAARHYNIKHATIVRWNKQLHIYEPQTASYPLSKRTEVLNYAAKHGVRAAARQFKVATHSIEIWNSELKIYGSFIRKFSKEQKIEILQYARDYGVIAAADKYDVSPTTIISWNGKLHVYQLKKPYTNGEKIKILTFARDNGMTAAEQKFDLPSTTILRWNKEFHIYTPQKTADYKQCMEEEKIQILNHAKMLYDKMPADSRSAHQAFILVAAEYNVTQDQVRKWNKKYPTVPLRAQRKTPVARELIEEAQSALTSARGHITRASRQSGISENMLNKMKKDKKIKFDKGQRKIKTYPPVGPRKARIISGIIAALLKSKE